MIELPEFVTGAVVERTHRRALELQDAWKKAHSPRARAYLVEGMNRARARDKRLLAFLEFGAEHLRKMNDEQKARIEQHGYARTDFSEFSTWRLAYEKAMEPEQHPEMMFRVAGWVYAAVAEALVRGG